MNTKKVITVCLLLLAAIHTSSARFVTLIVSYDNPTNEVQILAGEVIELRGHSLYPLHLSPPFTIMVTKDDVDFDLAVPPQQGTYSYPGVRTHEHIITGPARIRITRPRVNSQWPAPSYYCTFNITPEPFAPDRTALVPPGTNQTRVTLECSTNLLHWSAATNGVYGPLPEAKFFRIKLEPLQ